MDKMIVRDLGDLQEVEIHALADLHLGESTCNIKAFRKWRDMILEASNRYVILNGDVINMALKDSKSDIYSEKLKPSEQLELLKKELEPVKHRILVATGGNHDKDRVAKGTGIDILQHIFLELGIPEVYVPAGAFLKVKFGKRTYNQKQQVYNFYINHQTSSSLPTIERFCGNLDGVDCYVFSHVHKPLSRVISKVCVDSRNDTIRQKDCYILITGSFLDWIGSYGQAKNMQPQANIMGYFKLSGKERKIEVVL